MSRQPWVTGLTVCRALILNKQKIVLAPASSAYLHSLKEVLASPGIAAQIKVGSAAAPLL